MSRVTRPLFLLLIGLALVTLSGIPAAAMESHQYYERKEKSKPRPTLEEETHLAIAMGGAVALGAFEAGILAEITCGLARHNREFPGRRYVIDVLAGASAGSMSLAIMARELYDPSADVFASDYPLQSVYHKAWVEQIGVLGLIDTDRSTKLEKDPYLFDEQDIYSIANSALGCSLRQEVPLARLPRAMAPGERSFDHLSLAPDRLALGMTLSNMEGLTRPIHFEGAVYWQTFYDDKRMFLLGDRGRRVSLLQDPDIQLEWNEVALTAIASGAFPFAFEPVPLERRGLEYEQLPGEFERPEDKQVFHYVDGGFFDNDPLHLAQQLARLIDEEEDGEAEEIVDEKFYAVQQTAQRTAFYELLRNRRFIYLAPHVPVMHPEEQVDLASDLVPPVPTDHLLPYAQRIVAMGLGTAGGQGFRAYIREVDANQSAIKELLGEVHELRDETALVEDLLRALDFMAEAEVGSGDIELLRRFINFAGATVRDRSLARDVNLPIELARSIDFSFDWGEAETEARWLEEQAAWQHRQLFMRLFEARELLATNNFVLITATDEQPVAGGAFAHFGGFFNRQLREFDFVLGQYYAQQTLIHDLDVSVRDPISIAELDSLRAPLRSIASLASHFATLEERTTFRDKAEQRLRGYIDHADLPRLARPWAFSMGNRWLDSKVYHQPRGLLIRALVGYDEFHTISAGAALDPFNILSRLAGKEAHKLYYDNIFRLDRNFWPQIFMAAEYGYWDPRGQHALDWGGMLQVHWRINGWIAPRPTLEFGRRDFDGGGGEGWYHSVGVEIGSFHLGVKTDRSPSLGDSKPRSMLRMGFSIRPAPAWRSVATMF